MVTKGQGGAIIAADHKAIEADIKKINQDIVIIRIARAKLRADGLLENPNLIKIDTDNLIKQRLQKQADQLTLRKDLDKITQDDHGHT